MTQDIVESKKLLTFKYKRTMNLFRFDLEFDDFSEKEQTEIVKDADELCCKAIESISGINRIAFKNAKKDDCPITYTWRNVYIFSLNCIFNVPVYLISRLNNMHQATIFNIVKRVSESKDKKMRNRVNRMYGFINQNY